MALGLNRVTPPVVKRWRDAFVFLFAGIIPFAADLAPLIHIAASQFTTVCALGILLTHFGAKLFGLDDQEAVAQLQGKINEIKNRE